MAATTLLSDNGVTSGITGYQLTGGNDGTLQLQTTTSGGTATTAMTIDTSQNVGIGTTSPAYRLDVSTSSADATQISKGASDGYFTQYKEGTTLVGYIYSSTGSSNPLRIGAGNPKPLTLETSGVERMRIDSSGNVGIGNNAPTYKLDVTSSGAIVGRAISSGSTQAFFAVRQSGGAQGYLSVDASNVYLGSSIGSTGNKFAVSLSAPDSAATITTAGNLQFGTANAGIVFNKTGALNNSTLNDYEEGTWTPNVGGNATYSGQVGIYTKIGRMVTVQCDMAINLIGTGATGLVYGLPFPCSGGNYYAANISYFSGLSKTVFSVMGIVPIASNPYVYFETVSNTAGQSTANDSQSIFQNGSRVIFTATYFTA